jgi:Protein of unknown function (DUF2855)
MVRPMTTALITQTQHIAETQLETTDNAPLVSGEVRVRVDKFSFTSNNITYAAFGDAMQYWQFFPTGKAGWGTVPVWGFGTVVQSSHADIAAGEQLYGYWPFASHATLSPGKLTAGSLVDTAAHRSALHPVYNLYTRCSADPMYTPETEDIQALLRPLFTTSFLIDDFLFDNAFFGANTMLLSSASSKTAYGTAHFLSQRKGIEVIGLTSERNRAFCESLGCYSRVLSYEQLDALAADTACVYVDFAGSAQLRRDIHTRFTQLAYNCSIGGTHVADLGNGKNLPGPKPTLFFAPAQIKKRYADWGAEVFGTTVVSAWRSFCIQVNHPQAPWMTVQHHNGPAAAAQAYALVLAGQGDPRVGHMVSMQA